MNHQESMKGSSGRLQSSQATQEEHDYYYYLGSCYKFQNLKTVLIQACLFAGCFFLIDRRQCQACRP